jgi:DNA polymerase I
MLKITDSFEEVWLIDTEYVSLPGERPDPVCLVAWELRSGRKLRLWKDRLGPVPPFSTAPECLLVAFYASAEVGFFLANGWPKPTRILDLFVEYRNRHNCLPTITGNNKLIGALAQYGLDTIGASEKQEMIDLIQHGEPWSNEEQTAILDYCESDVAALSRLLPIMLSYIDLPRAIHRGRYMAADASIMFTGTPIDVELLNRVIAKWPSIIDKLIAKVDSKYGCYDGRSFRRERFRKWLNSNGLWWPEENGQLLLNARTFHEMVRIHPQVSELRELMDSVSKMRLNSLTVGSDGFNRRMLSAFGQKASRNSPSNAKFIFGPSCWMRGLIKPFEGWAVAYLDWEQQEFGIAAALSNDRNMIDDYNSGDAYLGFAKRAKAIPSDGTKKTHRKIRDLYKTCVLGIGYGMEERSLARRIDKHLLVARELLQQHHYIYRQYWAWVDNRVKRAMWEGSSQTVFGWTYNIDPRMTDRQLKGKRLRSLQNFPMQAHGAEILRLAICYAVEAGLLVCAPVHDAVLIMAPLDRIDADAAQMSYFMEKASEVVLQRLKLRTEGHTPDKIIRYPDRYMDEDRGRPFFEEVMRLL